MTTNMKKVLEKAGHEKGAAYILLILRLALGWLIFYPGITKLLEPGWIVRGWLKKATYSHFKEVFLIFAENPIVDADRFCQEKK